MRAYRCTQQSGLTLIEIMVAIALLGILAAFAAPAFSGALERARLRGAVDDLISLINSSRQQAVKQDRDVNLTLRGTSTAWCAGARSAVDPAPGSAVAAASACDCLSNANLCLVDGQVSVLSSAALGSLGSAPTIDAADIAVVFDRKLGVLQDLASAGNVELASSSGDYRVRVELFALGQARACIPTGAYAFGGYRPC